MIFFIVCAAFKRVSRLEGIIPALETSHALAYLEKICPTLPNGTKVVVNFSGRGDKDVQTVTKYLKLWKRHVLVLNNGLAAEWLVSFSYLETELVQFDFTKASYS